MAVQNGHKEIVDALLKVNANVNAENEDKQTPLHLAAYNGHKEIVDALLKANVDQEKNDYSTILHCAVHNGHEKIVEALLERGVNVNTKGDLTCINPTSTTIIKIFKNKKLAYYTAADCSNQLTALHLAAEKGYVNIVEQLIKVQGININEKDNNGYTALHLAAKSGNKEIVDALLAKKANVNEENGEKQTPLHLAVISGIKEVVEALLEKGANVDLVDKRGNNPLDLTTHKEIKALIESRKNTNNNKDNITNAEKDNDVEIKTVDNSSTIQAEEQTSTFLGTFKEVCQTAFFNSTQFLTYQEKRYQVET